MRPSEFASPLDPTSAVPIYLQLANALETAIRDGRLPLGAPLPGSRTLAEELNISRTPVFAAYGELRARGWIETNERNTTYVVRTPPPDTVMLVEASSSRSELAFDMPTRQDLVTSQMAKVTKLSEGLPDARLLMADTMGRAYHRAARQLFRNEISGAEASKNLQDILSSFIGVQRDIHLDPESILLTRGKRHALSLICRGLLNPGELIAVEEPGAPGSWETFREAKARLVGVPVDENGLIPEALDALLQREPIRFLYLTPRFQMPTMTSLSEERKRTLLDLAKRHQFRIIEDDSEADYTFESEPMPPLMAQDHKGSVIYLASFSRLLAPGVRLGFLLAEPSIVQRLTALKQRIDSEGDPVLELSLAALIQSGEIQRHILRVRCEYQSRRDMTLALMEKHFGSRLETTVPDGGLAFWIRVQASLDLNQWSKNCADKGVLFQPGSSYTLDRTPLPAFRLGYATFNPEEMNEILLRMREVYPE